MYFPGRDCAAHFEKDRFVWEQNGRKRAVSWSKIRSVTTGPEGATLDLGKSSLLVSKSIVWYEFVVEDIIEKARASNPRYEGPVPVPKTRSLEIPQNSQERAVYCRRAQRFYKKRCPNYEEFKAFLAANPDWRFTENSYYECSMALCSGSPVDEGYKSDLVIPRSYKWYFQFEKKTGEGKFLGSELLEILNSIKG